MSTITSWYGGGTNALVAKETRTFSGNELSKLDEAPILPNWFWQPAIGVPRRINSIELRKYAKSPWVQMVKRTIKNQVMNTRWEVVPTDEEDPEDYTADIEKVTTLLNYPNRNNETFWSLFGAWLDDVMDLDAGVIWKGRNVAGELVELFSYDGSTFLMKVDDHSVVENFLQFSYKAPKGAPLPFVPQDIVYGKVGSNTDQYPYGWSPLQSIQQEVELMIQSTRANKEFFQNNAIPDGMISMPMGQDDLDRFRANWEADLKGRPHRLAFVNTPDLKFTPMAMTNKDMQWLEGQDWYLHVIFGAFGLSTAEVGYYKDVNRASQEGQERISVKNAVRPYLKLIKDKINREIITELVDHDRIMFKWFPKDDQAEKLEHEQMMAKVNSNVLTINEVRKKEGLEPVEWGDQPMGITMQENSSDSEEKDEKKDDKEKKEKPEKEKEDSKKLYKRLFTSFIKNGQRRFGETSN
jgi:HK97 family phage portal protein